jgi:DNA-directed RNA polymerase sigma subunit (sigma70/sigma32)
LKKQNKIFDAFKRINLSEKQINRIVQKLKQWDIRMEKDIVITKLSRTSQTLVQENGREPSVEEIAEKMGMSLEKVQKILKMRFGIEEKKDHTLEEVGQDFELTRERIRQIEDKALRKLKHSSRADKLRSFIEN